MLCLQLKKSTSDLFTVFLCILSMEDPIFCHDRPYILTGVGNTEIFVPIFWNLLFWALNECPWPGLSRDGAGMGRPRFAVRLPTL